MLSPLNVLPLRIFKQNFATKQETLHQVLDILILKAYFPGWK